MVEGDSCHGVRGGHDIMEAGTGHSWDLLEQVAIGVSVTRKTIVSSPSGVEKPLPCEVFRTTSESG